jgi:hypothetical protein
MTPQLFINYKLKSVAHLPWRMLTYKALNTFIDDLFAFVIKMPVMYRIGCLRDGEAWRAPGLPVVWRWAGWQDWGPGPGSWLPPHTIPPVDVVFFIYLYQRWIYRVDPTRVNEFGMSGEGATAAAPLTPAPTPTTATAGTREEASTSLSAKPTLGHEPQDAPPKPAEDKKKD